MAIRYNQATQNRIEKIVEDAGYVIRYERGNFQSGYCILESKKVVVLNKFLQLEGRINTLIDLIPTIGINPDALTPENRRIYDEAMGAQPPRKRHHPDTHKTPSQISILARHIPWNRHQQRRTDDRLRLRGMPVIRPDGSTFEE